MTTQRSHQECRAIVLALLREHGALSRQELMAASPLDRYEVTKAVDGLQKNGTIQRRVPPDGVLSKRARYEIAPKGPTNAKRAVTVVPPQASFDGLLAAWGIAMPKRTAPKYRSRVIQADDLDADIQPNIPKLFAMAAASK